MKEGHNKENRKEKIEKNDGRKIKDLKTESMKKEKGSEMEERTKNRGKKWKWKGMKDGELKRRND